MDARNYSLILSWDLKRKEEQFDAFVTGWYIVYVKSKPSKQYYSEKLSAVQRHTHTIRNAVSSTIIIHITIDNACNVHCTCNTGMTSYSINVANFDWRLSFKPDWWMTSFAVFTLCAIIKEHNNGHWSLR